MSKLIDIATEEEWNAHSKALPPSTLQIINFHAPWAAPCAQMTMVLETLASSYPVTNPLQTSWVSMNAEDVMEVSEAFNVTAVPFLVLTRNGIVLEEVSGSDATKVRTAIEKHVNAAGAGVRGAEKRDLSVYAPTKSDPATAPALTSGAVKEEKEDLHARLTNLVKAAPVMLFMKGTPSAPQCGFSRQLVALLRENSVKYGFFNILADDEVRQGLKEFADWPTFPQLWIDGELVGGLDIVKEEMANDPEFLKPYSPAKTAAV
ncbi:glutaredoxin [Phlyctema vagabunda]|uniref:Glutaredoxin n=1 Tax=Phlyctema vagabunda TaxID=108571 RepID=A0ABR4PDC4_9HELO